MRILWHNILALILTAVATAVLIRYRTATATFLGNVARIGPGHSTDEQTLGLIAFGICGVVLVAIVRLLTRNHRD